MDITLAYNQLVSTTWPNGCHKKTLITHLFDLNMTLTPRIQTIWHGPIQAKDASAVMMLLWQQ